MGRGKKGIPQVKYWPFVLRSIWKGKVVDNIRCLPVKLLKQKDKSTGWKITQAVFGMPDIGPEECRAVLKALDKRDLLGICSGKDRDGDTTLHTAVKTGDECRLKVLLDELPPALLNEILETPNKLGKTPLQLAFDRRNWPALQLILEICVKNHLCSRSTGIGENLTSNTLLHQAMDKKECQYLRIYLDMIRRSPGCGKPDLLACDETGQTPWSYLMNYCDHELLEDTLCVLNDHDVDVSELITDKNSQSTMLHLAYRKSCQRCIDLLKNAGAKPDKKDKRGFRADQRNHMADSRPRRRKCKTSRCKRTDYQLVETDQTTQPHIQHDERKNSLAPIQIQNHQEIMTSTNDFQVVQRKHKRRNEKSSEEKTSHNIVKSPGRNKYHCAYSWDHLRVPSKPEPPAPDNTFTVAVKQLQPPWNSFNAGYRPRQEQLNSYS